MSDIEFNEIETANEVKTRAVTSAFRFWTACGVRRCRRARACVGAVTGGSLPCYAGLDDEARVFLDATSDACGSGAALDEAMLDGGAAVARFRRRREMADLTRDVARLMRAQIGQLRRRMSRDRC